MINNVVLVGRITADPELRYSASGVAVSTFRLAVNRNFTSADGTREADFINCVIWRKSAETLANYARKGTLLGVTGRIQTRNYENQQGQHVYVTEVVAENFQLLESRSASDQRQSNNASTNSSGNYDQSNKNSVPDFGRDNDPFSGSSIDIGDDDLPF